MSLRPFWEFDLLRATFQGLVLAAFTGLLLAKLRDGFDQSPAFWFALAVAFVGNAINLVYWLAAWEEREHHPERAGKGGAR